MSLNYSLLPFNNANDDAWIKTKYQSVPTKEIRESLP